MKVEKITGFFVDFRNITTPVLNIAMNGTRYTDYL